MMLYIILAICSIIYGLVQSWPSLRSMYKLRNFNGPECSSLIFGNWDIICQPPEILYHKMKKLSEDYYPHCFLRILYVPVILVFSPEDFEIFTSTPKHSKKSIVYNIFKSWLRNGLLISSGEKWRLRRKIITPAFHFSILKDYLKVFNEKSEDFVKVLLTNGSEAINVVPEIQEFALSSINETAMGLKATKDDSRHKAYRKAIADMEKLMNQFLARPWLQVRFLAMLTHFYWDAIRVVAILHDYTETKIKKRMESYERCVQTSTRNGDDDSSIYISKKKKRMAMLDILLEAQRDGNQINYEGICEEVDTFTFEGHDTVSAALSFCMFTIANHPNIQNEIFEEVNAILGDEIQQPTYDDLQRMELLERCIKETLRLYPSVHLISRITDEDTELHSGLIAPKDTMIMFSIVGLHRNPKIYPDPDKFDPDRFLPENCLHRHPFAYLPFSAGPRNCIGQRFAMLEMKSFLCAVIRNFHIIPVDTHLELKMETILRAKNGIKVKFLPRK